MVLPNSQIDLADNLNFIDFKLELEFLKDYCHFMKNNFEVQNNSINERVKKHGLSRDTEEYACFIWEIFPSIHWSSMFIVAFGLFEKSLNDICAVISYIYKPPFALNDIKDRGIKRASLYIKKTLKYNKIFNTKSWNKISDYRKIRNLLTHSDGEFDKENTKLLYTLKRYKELIVTEDNKDFINIKINEKIVFNAIDEYCRFILDLNEGLKGQRL